jgi:mono/diheme cytochrome c family protein
MFKHTKLIALAAAMALMTVAAPKAEEMGEDLSKLGAQEYKSNCGICHGINGKGDGPITQYFVEGGYVAKAFPDLTALKKNNGGVFPYERVYKMIDGRAEVKAHGPREMPVWGDEYNEQAYKKYGEFYASKAFVRTRILALIEHIDSLQQ